MSKYYIVYKYKKTNHSYLLYIGQEILQGKTVGALHRHNKNDKFTLDFQKKTKGGSRKTEGKRKEK